MSEWQKRTLYQQLCRTAERWPNNDFIIYRETRPTYREAVENVDSVARGLLSLGIRRGDNVAVWMGNCPEWVYTWYACASIGACLVPMNTRYRTHEIEYILKQSDAVALVMKDHFLNIDFLPILKEVAPELGDSIPGDLQAARLPELRRVIVLGKHDHAGTISYDKFLSKGDDVSPSRYQKAQAEVEPDDRVTMVYTSGTTGFPKGAMHSHNILRHLSHICENYRYTERDRILVGALPFFHVFGGFGGVLCALLSGACVVVMDAFEPKEWLELWAKERCTSVYGVPTMYITALDHPDFERYDLSSTRIGQIGAAFAGTELLQAVYSRMGLKALRGYGMTEACAFTTQTRRDDDFETIASTNGKPIDEIEVKVVDAASGETLPPNTPGEIWTRGHHVMIGYYKKPVETAEAVDKDGWLHTGDLGSINERGYLRLTGRLKDMLKVGGFSTYPAEIENYLSHHPKVKVAQIVGVPDYKMGEVVMAFIELKEGVTATSEEIIDFCKGKLANFKVPRYVQFVTEWPETATGRVQKFKLRDKAIDDLGLRHLA